MPRTSYAALFTLLALLLAAPASAQQTDGALRLHLETGVLGFESETVDPDGAPDSETTKTTTFGPGSSGLGFGLGFGASDSLVVGANVALQFITIDPEGRGSVSGSRLTLMPYLELLLGDGTARPFVGGALLLSFDSFEDVSTTLFGIAGIGGVHIFMTDSYSFDIGGRLYLATGETSVDAGGMNFDSSITRLGLIALIGVSGWSI